MDSFAMKESDHWGPKGLVLGLVLFTLFISYLELEASSVVTTCADDTNLLRTMKTNNGIMKSSRKISLNRVSGQEHGI